MRPRLAGLAHILRQQPYEAAIGLASTTGILEIINRAGSGALAVYPVWLVYASGMMLFAGGLLTLAGLAWAGLTLSDVGRVLARRVEQSGQYLLAGVLGALACAAISFGLRAAIGGSVDFALGTAALARAITISRVIGSAGREETGLVK